MRLAQTFVLAVVALATSFVGAAPALADAVSGNGPSEYQMVESSITSD